MESWNPERTKVPSPSSTQKAAVQPVAGIHRALKGLPCGSDGKESACNAGDQGSIPGSGRSPGEGNGYPLQYSCLENSTDRGVCWPTVLGLSKSQTRLSDSLHSKKGPGREVVPSPLEVELRRRLTPYPRCPPHPSFHRSLLYRPQTGPPF